MLITTEDFKQHIEINTNEHDDMIALYIESVTEFINEYLKRSIEEQSNVTEYFDGDDLNDHINLSSYPLTDTTTFVFQYRTGSYSNPTWNDFDEDYYQVDEEIGQILTDSMYDGRRNIKVVYSAGFAKDDIPKAIKTACLKLVAKIYNKKRSDGFKDESLGDASISWDKFLSDDIKLLLSPYRNLSL